MSGFGGIKRGEPDPGEPMTPGDRFYAAIHYIFPDSQSSRLARVFDVAQRTAQKWIAYKTVPPDNVQDYVYSQQKVLREQDFPREFERLIREQGAGLDGEVIAAQVSRFYETMMAYKIR